MSRDEYDWGPRHSMSVGGTEIGAVQIGRKRKRPPTAPRGARGRSRSAVALAAVIAAVLLLEGIRAAWEAYLALRITVMALAAGTGALAVLVVARPRLRRKAAALPLVGRVAVTSRAPLEIEPARVLSAEQVIGGQATGEPESAYVLINGTRFPVHR
jgi:hypothetical protein